jgi:hypothetical protein
MKLFNEIITNNILTSIQPVPTTDKNTFINLLTYKKIYFNMFYFRLKTYFFLLLMENGLYNETNTYDLI